MRVSAGFPWRWAVAICAVALAPPSAQGEDAECEGVLEQALDENREIIREVCHEGPGASLMLIDHLNMGLPAQQWAEPDGSGPSLILWGDLLRGAEPEPSVTHFEVTDIPEMGCTSTSWAGRRPGGDEGVGDSSCTEDGRTIDCPGRIPIPLVRPEATYPPEAARRGVEGWVELMAGVSPDGEMLDPRVIEGQPAGVFDHAALSAFSEWVYTNPVEGTDVGLVVRICFLRGE